MSCTTRFLIGLFCSLLFLPTFGLATEQPNWTLIATEDPDNGDQDRLASESLFNGKDLSGWTVKYLPKDQDKSGYWSVVDGTITAKTPAQSNHGYIWLVTDKEYDNFELSLKVQTFAGGAGNSGVQVRSRYDDVAGWLDGPQVDIHPPGPWRSGFIYDETRGVNAWLWPDVGAPANAKPKHAPQGWKWFHTKEQETTSQEIWNDIQIVCRGTTIKTTVNGVTVADYDGQGRLDDELHRQRSVGMKGHIALQIHPGGGLHVRFKDIQIRNLP